MARVLEFVVEEDDRKLIAVLRPEAAFLPGTLEEEYSRQDQHTVIEGLLKAGGRARFGVCYLTSPEGLEDAMNWALAEPEQISEEERRGWLMEGWVSPGQFLGRAPVSRVGISYRCLEASAGRKAPLRAGGRLATAVAH